SSGLRYGVLAEAQVGRWHDGGLLVSTAQGVFRRLGTLGFEPEPLQGLAEQRLEEELLRPVALPGGDSIAYSPTRLLRLGRNGWRAEDLRDMRRGALVAAYPMENGHVALLGNAALLVHDPAVDRVTGAAPQVRLRRVLRMGQGTPQPWPLRPGQVPVF